MIMLTTTKRTYLARVAATLLLAVLCSIGVRAQDAKIIIWLNDGNKSEVLFADMPELTYADGYINLQSNSPSTTFSWPIENVQKLTFENVNTAIRDVKATGLDLLGLTKVNKNGDKTCRNSVILITTGYKFNL